MMRLIQHISVSIWLGFCISLSVIFSFLPELQAIFPQLTHQTLGLGIFMGVFAAASMVQNILGHILIKYRLQKARKWEQAGIVHRAGKQYEKAVVLYDSFLIFPPLSKSIREKLLHRLAIFCLSESGNGASAFRKPSLLSSLETATLYLKFHPEDSDLARLWLEQFSENPFETNPSLGSDALVQQVLCSLANIHWKQLPLSSMILKIFLHLGRTDHPAIQLYRRMLEHPDLPLEEKQKIYLLVGEEREKGNLDRRHREEWTEILVNATLSPLEKKKREADRTQQIQTGKKQKVQKRFRAMAAGIVLIVIIGMCTRIYLTPNRPLPFFSSISKNSLSQEYSIQLGAFLDLALAQDLAKKLEACQSRPVKIIQVRGGQKTWHIVRIKGFATKDDAKKYGNILASENMIQNFFVCISDSE